MISAQHFNDTYIAYLGGRSKIARILAYLLTPCNSLNRFEAERLGDHCLPSTISDLFNDYDVQFLRESERVPNRWEKPCTVTRYCLPDSQREYACEVLKWLGKSAALRRKNPLPRPSQRRGKANGLRKGGV